MKVVLLEDVKAQGKKGDIIEVSEGYAKNFLIPKKLGVIATNEALNNLKLQKANDAKIAKELYDNAVELKNKFEASEITLKIKGGKDGKTYGSIASKDIASAISEQLGIDLDKKKIMLDSPIKNFGIYNVDLKLHKDVKSFIKVNVLEE